VEKLRELKLPHGILLYSELNGAALEERKKVARELGSVCCCKAAPGLGLPSLKEFAMSTFTTAVKTFIQDENGVTAIEYGLIAALIATALVGAVGLVTVALKDGFTSIAGHMSSVP
jgi:pilus assembly protein Flp/PilA